LPNKAASCKSAANCWTYSNPSAPQIPENHELTSDSKMWCSKCSWNGYCLLL